MLKRFAIAVLIALTGSCAVASTDVVLFTILGNPADPNADTILIDPTPVEVKGPFRWMTLHMNRARQRVSTDGISFRSFTSIVEFNCDKGTARFAKTQFYNDPLWTSPGQSFNYPPTMVRPMAFRDVNPNPVERVIKAACVTTGSGTGTAAR